MGRREERDAIQDTWNVMREPKDRDGNRHERRKRATLARNAWRGYLNARTHHAPARAVVESSEERSSPDAQRPAPRDSAAASEGG